ncbi:hypothetical protein FOL47_007399 [Perkinsus chesapeaki]|uniref:Transmembrane protein n=1 Tax=Perkinsus chesapeaki TaxID=330153 RepID=A0A7J6LLE2_PERCH|nr:hypothetical protein FOL47_007399 [Perkinsus chesapeaki]
MDHFLTPLAVTVSFVTSCLFLSGNEDGLVVFSSKKGLDPSECEAMQSTGFLIVFLAGVTGGLLLGRSIWKKDVDCRDRTREREVFGEQLLLGCYEERENSDTSEDRSDDLEDDSSAAYPVRVRKHIEKKAAGLGAKFQPLMSSLTVKGRSAAFVARKVAEKSPRSSRRFGAAPALGIPLLK